MLATKYRIKKSEVQKLAKCEHFLQGQNCLIKYLPNQLGNCRLSIAISRKIKLCNAKKGEIRRQIKNIFLQIPNKDTKSLDFFVILLKFKQGDQFAHINKTISDFLNNN